MEGRYSSIANFTGQGYLKAAQRPGLAKSVDGKALWD
jgi:hypothetical protein